MRQWLRRLLGVFRPRPSKEWNLTAGIWGKSTCILSTEEDGRLLRITGWHPNCTEFRVGDTFLFLHPKGGNARCLLKTLHLPGEPPNMWYGTASPLSEDDCE